MSQVGKITLKGYFNAGDVPTEANFADLVDSCHNGQGGFQIVTADTDLSADTTGGTIIINGAGVGNNELTVKLPVASTANIGLSYNVYQAIDALNVRVGPDGATGSALTGSLVVISTTADQNAMRATAVGASHVSMSTAVGTANSNGGASGSFLRFDYLTATSVLLSGTIITLGANPTGGAVNQYGAELDIA
tara:strand:+ start:778 stop:1353 length:576 start_codon:yes stop_codon:yes gene_type:complete